MHNMKIGAVYPQIELDGSPDAVRAIGSAVEAAGYDHLLAYDHVLGAVHTDREPPLRGPYTENDPFHDPFMLFAYLAGRTERLEFVTGILIVPQRQTALVARQAADLALLSGNRFRMGVGVGWSHVEYEALGQDFHTRGAREDEQIGLLRQLWNEDVVSFEGRFDTIERAALVPRPTQPIDIWLGGFGDAAFRRAAKLGDGFIFGGGSTEVQAQWTRVQELLAAEGRSTEEFGAEYCVWTDKGAQSVADRIERWREQGGTHASVVTMNLGLDSAEAHIDFLGSVSACLDR